MSLFSTIRDVTRLEGELKAALSRVVSLESELKEERERNRRREDLMTDRFLQKQGVFPIPPPVKPQLQLVAPESQPSLNAYEEGMLQVYEEDAVRVGRPRLDGHNLFWARKLGQPDPFPLPVADAQVDWEL